MTCRLTQVFRTLCNKEIQGSLLPMVLGTIPWADSSGISPESERDANHQSNSALPGEQLLNLGTIVILAQVTFLCGVLS